MRQSHSPGRSNRLFRFGRLRGLRRRGASVVEFALVAPVFVLLVLGMIEYGRMIMVQQIITNASREGARQAVLDGATAGDVTAQVNTYLANASVQGATVTITPDPLSDAAFGDPVTVAVDISFSQVSWLPSPLFLANTSLQAQTVMRRETLE
ncbi:MAG: pilus assembly protein [Pirellulaceae bacterium]|nr:pilus assembly protein [Pirellulaceae bacterium]